MHTREEERRKPLVSVSRASDAIVGQREGEKGKGDRAMLLFSYRTPPGEGPSLAKHRSISVM